MAHSPYIGTINSVYLNLKKIKTFSLRHERYGFEKQVGPFKIDRKTFLPNIRRLLHFKGYEFTENKKELWFIVDYEEVNNLFYKHDCHLIQFVFSKTAQAYTVKFYVLQQDIEGNTLIKGITAIPRW